MSQPELEQRVFRSINPATEEVTAEYPEMGELEIEATLARAQRAFLANSRQPVSWRAERMLALAEGLRRERDSLARLVTAEMGKPLTEAQAEVDKCAFACDYFARQGEALLADQPAPSDSPRSFVAFRPLGVVLAIMPWNYPFWQVVRFAAPGLMAGNAGVLKHATNCLGSGRAISRLVDEAGFPEGSLAALEVGPEAIPPIIADPRVRAVTLTGSDRAGMEVASLAGGQLKKTVMELGGSDFFLVLKDADLAKAAEVGVRARFQNAGQTCIAAKRFILVDEVADEFQERFLELAKALPLGDPLDAATRIGPLARQDLRQRLHEQVERSLAAGAQLLLGAELPPGRGFFYPATVVGEARPGMAIFDEETFGPVAALSRVADEEEAVELANRSQFGLGGNVWTEDVERGVRLAARLDTGGVFVNGMTHSDPRLPFGGVRHSGYGRELHELGIREFTNIQTVWRP